MKTASRDRNRKKTERGRPCLLDEGRLKKIVTAIHDGLPLKQAAHLAGISYDTINRWRIRSEQADAPAEFRHFCKALIRAKAVAMRRLVKNIRKSGRKDWRAAAWLLERRHPEEFGKATETACKEQVAALPSSPWDDHPAKQDIREGIQVREIMKKIARRLCEVPREQWRELAGREGRKDSGRVDWSVKRPAESYVRTRER